MAQLSYCGIPCVKVCPLYKATQENDVEMKKILYERQEMKKKFGLDFDPDKVFCHTCKPGDKPKKVGMDTCPVRQCALANGVESCVQCANLDACDKEYWKKWPGQWNRFVTRTLSWLEPALIALIGAFVLLVVLSVLLPIIWLNRSLG